MEGKKKKVTEQDEQMKSSSTKHKEVSQKYNTLERQHEDLVSTYKFVWFKIK